MRTITLCRSHNVNYTPRSLMFHYAKKHEPSVKFVPCSPPVLVLQGRRYTYNGWDIETYTVNGRLYDRIDLHLHEIP